jgi:hypothetical protein
LKNETSIVDYRYYTIRYNVSIKKIIKELNKIIDNVSIISSYNNNWICDVLKSEIYRYDETCELITKIESKTMKCVLEMSKSYIKSKYPITMENAYFEICNKEMYVKYNPIYNIIITSEILERIECENKMMILKNQIDNIIEEILN